MHEIPVQKQNNLFYGEGRPQHYMFTYLLLEAVQKYYLFFCFFPLTTLLPIQDVSRVVQTHLGAVHTHFVPCYAGFGFVMANMLL